MTIRVRPYAPADARRCCDIINDAIEVMDGLNEQARSHIRASNTPHRLGADLERWITLIAECNDQVVGLGAVDGDEVKRIYIDPDVRGVGAATALLAALEEIASQRCDEIRLEASPSSVGFYESHGYRQIGRGRLDIGEASFRFVRMTKVVRPHDNPSEQRQADPAT